MRKYIALVLVVFLVLLSVGCTANDDFPQISARKVFSVSLWSQDSESFIELNEEQTETFIQLYNQSQYYGEATGAGGTPEYGAFVYYKNDDFFIINKFNANYADVEVTFYKNQFEKKDWCYVINPELMDYIAGLLIENECDNEVVAE